jgi:hypothetical protein
MEVGIIIATAVGIQFVQVRRKFGPQGQQFLTLGLPLTAG